MSRFGTTFVMAFCLGLACGQTEPYTCEADPECVLSGVAGVCTTEGHCAYPDSTCAGGFRHPGGAPNGLAGVCASGGGTSGGTSDGGGSDDDGDEGSSGSSVEDEGSSGSSDEATDATSDDGVCDNDLVIDRDAAADAFFVGGGTCSPVACQEFNFGGSPVRELSAEKGAESVFAVRFDAQSQLDSFSEVVSARLHLTVPNRSGARIGVAGLDPAYPWVEGFGTAEPAERGESNWIRYGRGDWPSGGPPAAVVVSLADFEVGSREVDVAIELDVAALTTFIADGGDSVLVQLLEPVDAVSVGAREGITPPRLELSGCP